MIDGTKADRRTRAQEFIEYAQWMGQGVFYRWGGDDPSAWDCSGLAIECLQSFGLFPDKSDTTADGLLKRFSAQVCDSPTLGCLVFYLKQGKAYHVGIYVGGGRYISAEGGGRTTNSRATAIKQNAYVRERPVDSRSEKPVYADIFRLRGE